MIEIKEKICRQLKAQLELKAAEARQALAALKESRNSETKSSAGDKYETGRAMVQMEMDKHEVQLSKTQSLIHELSRIDIERPYEKAETGSLVLTTQGNYFISVGLGKLEVGEETVYVISLASPVGMLLKGKRAGDTVQFQGKDFTIKEIL